MLSPPKQLLYMHYYEPEEASKQYNRTEVRESNLGNGYGLSLRH
jgi:hypothetical protein